MIAAWRLSRHAHYKKLCASASWGELSAEQRNVLNRHLKTCADCREIYSEYADINAALQPEISDDEETIAGLEASTQAAVLETVASYREQQATSADGPADTRPVVPFRSPMSEAARPHRLRWSAALAMVAVLSFALGIRYESLRFRRLRASETPKPRLQESRSLGSSTVSQNAQAQPDETAAIENELRDNLHSEQQREAALKATVDTRDKQLVSIEAANVALREEIAHHAQDLANTRALLASKSAELQRVVESANSDKATLVELRYKIQDLTEKANVEAADLQRERDLLSKGREIRDIIGARNLHIVDVYDADARGHTKRPFARAFYTEGESLVFYAYDLPAQRSNAQLSYVAWGQKNGKKSSIKNLGILVNDDQGQRRWSLNFSDPHVLAEIDSVFITLEPSGDAGQPSGKRMLTAYLNDAVNHP